MYKLEFCAGSTTLIWHTKSSGPIEVVTLKLSFSIKKPPAPDSGIAPSAKCYFLTADLRVVRMEEKFSGHGSYSSVCSKNKVVHVGWHTDCPPQPTTSSSSSIVKVGTLPPFLH